MENKNNEYGNGCASRALFAWKQKQIIEDAHLKYKERFCWCGVNTDKIVRRAKKRRIIKWTLFILLVISMVILGLVIPMVILEVKLGL